MLQFHSHLAYTLFRAGIGGRVRHHLAVIKPDANEESCKCIENKCPCIDDGDVERMFQQSGKRHKSTIHEDDGKTVESVTKPYILRLVVFVKLNHVETVGRNVVRGTSKCHQEEEEHRTLKPECSGQSEGNACQCAAHEHLHGEHPPAFCLQKVDERTPKRLHHPRQCKPPCVETHFGIGESHLHIHDD